jgi:hypothetical protein
MSRNRFGYSFSRSKRFIWRYPHKGDLDLHGNPVPQDHFIVVPVKEGAPKVVLHYHSYRLGYGETKNWGKTYTKTPAFLVENGVLFVANTYRERGEKS